MPVESRTTKASKAPVQKLLIRKPRITQVYTHWIVKCGWCGGRHPKATDGRNLFCSNCGR